jgi:hypothetical protein
MTEKPNPEPNSAIVEDNTVLTKHASRVSQTSQRPAIPEKSRWQAPKVKTRATARTNGGTLNGGTEKTWVGYVI